MFSSDDEWQWWLKMKVNRCHLWRTKHCPEIELQQLWVLDTTLKWMCSYLRFNLKKWNFKRQLERLLAFSLCRVSHTLILPLCCASVGLLRLKLRPAWAAVTALAWVPAGPGADVERLKSQTPACWGDQDIAATQALLFCSLLLSLGRFPLVVSFPSGF